MFKLNACVIGMRHEGRQFPNVREKMEYRRLSNDKHYFDKGIELGSAKFKTTKEEILALPWHGFIPVGENISPVQVSLSSARKENVHLLANNIILCSFVTDYIMEWFILHM